VGCSQHSAILVGSLGLPDILNDQLTITEISKQGKQEARDKLDALADEYPGDFDDRIPESTSGQTKSSGGSGEKKPENV